MVGPQGYYMPGKIMQFPHGPVRYGTIMCLIFKDY